MQHCHFYLCLRIQTKKKKKKTTAGPATRSVAASPALQLLVLISHLSVGRSLRLVSVAPAKADV